MVFTIISDEPYNPVLMEQVKDIAVLGRYALLGGIGVYVVALLADGKFLWQGILGVLLARLPEDASAEDRRRVRFNRIKWLLALPYFMFISLGRMRREHLVIAREKNLKIGIGYRITVVWHILWLAIMGCGNISFYLGLGTIGYAAVLLASRR